MRLSSTVFALLTAIAPLALYAGNPHILIKDPSGAATPVTSDVFAFGADNLGGGVFFFQNESGQTWGDLSVAATLPELTTITCGPGPFVTCTISETPTSGGFLYDIMFGPSRGAGISNGQIFSVNLNDSSTDPNGSGSWGAGTDFDARANVNMTPEPSALLLMLAGMLGIAGLVRYRRRPISV